jgi:hypothetical protein
MTEEKKFNPSCLPESALKKYSLFFEQRLAELNQEAQPSRPTKTECPCRQCLLGMFPPDGGVPFQAIHHPSDGQRA